VAAKSKQGKTKLDFKSVRADARPAERTVEVCFRADLRARLQELARQLQEAERERDAGNSLDAGGRSADLAQELEALRDQMVASTVEFRLRRLPRERWRDLVLEHPPGEDGGLAEVNADTFFPALIRECCYEPELDDDDWEWLLGPDQLSDAEYQALSNAAWAVNARDVEVPFSRTASRILQASEPGSRRHNGSDSL
jgi:hypothetical protein